MKDKKFNKMTTDFDKIMLNIKGKQEGKDPSTLKNKFLEKKKKKKVSTKGIEIIPSDGAKVVDYSDIKCKSKFKSKEDVFERTL